MMVRAPRAVDLLAKSPYLPRHLPGHGTTSVQDGQEEVHQGHHRREQAANTDFANRSTARGARTIMARK
jgi:hypothetical protein